MTRRIVIDDEWVRIEQFDDAPVGTCREVGDIAMVWAMARLADQLAQSLEFRRAYVNARTEAERMAVEPTDKVCMP